MRGVRLTRFFRRRPLTPPAGRISPEADHPDLSTHRSSRPRVRSCLELVVSKFNLRLRRVHRFLRRWVFPIAGIVGSFALLFPCPGGKHGSEGCSPSLTPHAHARERGNPLSRHNPPPDRLDLS